MSVLKLVNLNVHSARFQTVPFKISWAVGAPKFLFISLSPAHNNVFGVFARCAWFCIVRGLAGCLVYLSSALPVASCEGYLASIRANRLKPKAHVFDIYFDI